VGFAEGALDVLRDRLAITKAEECTGETRFVPIQGRYDGRILLVVYVAQKTGSPDSARRATRSEIRTYREDREKGI
jgi:uncharacterized DUF497 family protein